MSAIGQSGEGAVALLRAEVHAPDKYRGSETDQHVPKDRDQ